MSMTEDLDNFRLHYVGRSLENFILNDFSRLYIKLIRNRLSPWYEGKDKEAAQFTLLYVLENLTRLMAPITPFISEKIYQRIFSKMRKEPESIHLASWPVEEKVMIDRKLEKRMETVSKLIEFLNSLRQAKKVKLRWPISVLKIKTDAENRKTVEEFGEIIKSMGNIKTIRFTSDLDKKEKKVFECCELELGKPLMEEALIRELIRKVQIERKEKKLEVRDKINITLESDSRTEKILNDFKNDIMIGTGSNAIGFNKIKKPTNSLKFEKSVIDFEFEKA